MNPSPHHQPADLSRELRRVARVLAVLADRLEKVDRPAMRLVTDEVVESGHQQAPARAHTSPASTLPHLGVGAGGAAELLRGETMSRARISAPSIDDLATIENDAMKSAMLERVNQSPAWTGEQFWERYKELVILKAKDRLTPRAFEEYLSHQAMLASAVLTVQPPQPTGKRDNPVANGRMPARLVRTAERLRSMTASELSELLDVLDNDENWKPAAWFNDQCGIPSSTLRSAARRKTVKSRERGTVTEYFVPDARVRWPHRFPSE